MKPGNQSKGPGANSHRTIVLRDEGIYFDNKWPSFARAFSFYTFSNLRRAK